MGRQFPAAPEERSVVIGAFAMGRDVKTFAFLIRRHTQTDRPVNDLEQDRRDNGCPDHTERNRLDLSHEGAFGDCRHRAR
jgi:hypothetical protein